MSDTKLVGIRKTIENTTERNAFAVEDGMFLGQRISPRPGQIDDRRKLKKKWMSYLLVVMKAVVRVSASCNK